MTNKGGGGWGCPHEVGGICQHVDGKICDPGMKGCVLFGRFVFSDPQKNRPGGPHHRGPNGQRLTDTQKNQNEEPKSFG